MSWVGAWAEAPGDAGPTYADQSLRLLFTPLRGGETARVRLSNRFGSAPVTFRSAHVGHPAAGAALVPGPNVALRFDGAAEVTVPAGETVLSDPVTLALEAFEPLALSVFVPLSAPGPLGARISKNVLRGSGRTCSRARELRSPQRT